MIDTILYYGHSVLLLCFGVFLSALLAGISPFKQRNIFLLTLIVVVSGVLQLASLSQFGEHVVWKIYPLITHLPIFLLLTLYYRKRVSTSLAAITTTYLCCQPSKWIGLLIQNLTESYAAEMLTRCLVFLLFGLVSAFYLTPSLAKIFQKDTKSVWIFGSVPIVYYLFDYTMSIYTNHWNENNRVVTEFLPFFLCLVFMLFCLVYYREYEQKIDSERKEQIIRITVEQQSKEIDAVKAKEQEIRLLRHDMRHFLTSLAVCIEDGSLDKARQWIAAYSDHIEGTRSQRFCENDTLNCVLSSFAARCRENAVEFTHTVEIQTLPADELLFSSILLNALDNALEAVSLLPPDQKKIRLMLKNLDGKLLLSVKNPLLTPPNFVDGLPVSSKPGHGYGTQSIRYMSERLGGTCRFSVEDSTFILQVIL